MNKVRITILLLVGWSTAWSQTNTFPSSGNVGIGTSSPTSALDVRGSGLFTNGSNLDLALSTPLGKNGIAFNVSEYTGYSRFNLVNYDHGTEGSRFFQLQFNTDPSGLTIRKGGNIGIGTSTPNSKLDVYGTIRSSSSSTRFINLLSNGDGNSYMNFVGGASNSRIGFQIDGGSKMSILNNGNVGIGTTAPSSRLDVVGQIRISNSWDGVLLNSYSNQVYHLIGTYQGWDSEAVYIAGYNNANNSSIFTKRIRFGQQSTLTVDFSQNRVGIGTTVYGSHQLAVEGSIGAREVKVQVGPGWPDFVFEACYELPSLEEVETYIAKNKRLPEIPSESEVIENGIYLGEMNAKLLQKVEELTLYLIEQNKEIIKLKDKVQKLENQ